MADNSSNASGAMTITNTKLLTTSDYRLEFDGSNYTARRLSDGAEMTVSNTAGVLSFADAAGRDQGFSVEISGTATAGDRCILEPTRRGATDIAVELDQADQLAFAAPFRAEANLQNKGNGSIGQPSVEMVLNNPPVAPATLPDNFIADDLRLDHLAAR